MRKKIFQAMMAAAGSVLLASLIIILGCLYDYFGGLQEKQMHAVFLRHQKYEKSLRQ